ncbi:vWA domain-containing protein [Cohnella phaseoli]|uniref:von Willebrand factor type A domain-containing protein n=1 Tax=Cohnella phaseoli TaxID=456490 RepID=A0A3D9JR59_9BACL|nr:vWA domain-containing protein [Cohnella phaseoli]RED76289.1 von Willebrand factor type A domain-containing protein [Cohnella phaseoli]
MKPKKNSNQLSYLLTILCLCLTLTGVDAFFASKAIAATYTEQKIDVVLTVDASNSMKTSDKNLVANEAMKMFVDMASVQGDKIGLVSYTDQIVREKALLTINTPQDKEELKKFIDQIVRGSYTDIAVGVVEAVKILEQEREPGRFPMIVLLSDGNNSLRGSRTQEQSDKELNEAIDKAIALGIPIYTIGLNADGKLNKANLEDISKRTNGKSFVTSSAEDLPQILSEIFANHLKVKVIPLNGVVGNGQYQDVRVPIPNENVLEANISLISSKPAQVKLYDPSGQERAIPSDGIIYSKSNAYSLIKLSKPELGDWKLQVKGVDKDKIDINLVFNYDIQLVMEPLAPGVTYKKGDQVEVKAHLESNGQVLADEELYKDIKSTLLVTDLDTQQTEELPLTNSGQQFEGSYKVADAHDYELKIKVEDASFFRESEPVKISAKSALPQATPSPSVSPTPVTEKEKEPFPWLYVGGGAALLILLIVLALVILNKVKKANKGFYGQVIIEIRDEDTNERTSPQYKQLNGFKGKFKLHQLLQLAPELAETDKIVFVPGKDSIIIYNQTPCIIEKSGRAFDASKGKELKNNDRIKITLQKVNKSIWLDYIV